MVGTRTNTQQSAVALGRGSGLKRNSNLAPLRPAVLLLARTCLLPLASAAPFSLWSTSSVSTTEEPEITDPSSPSLWAYLGVAVALVLLGGAFAGLTIALMGQDETYLQVIATSGEGSERRHAARVLRLLKKGKHWVLVTLLLSNVITNETLPIVLDRSLGGGWPAVLSSTVLIVIFGEIAPQSVCVRYGLSIGAFCAPFVLVLMWIMSPVAWPTAKLLDYLLGSDHGTMYKKAGLKTLVQLHKTLGTAQGERLMEDEVTIINSVLDLKEKPVGDIMTPMQDVFTMSADTVLDERMMDIILSQGYSRIPIHMPDNNRNFVGMLLVKILITYDPEDAMRVRDFSLATLPETSPHTSCLDIINFFQEGKSHMVLVSDFPGQDKGALGVVTLEDVIEELIGEEIIDESDVFIDVHKAIRRLAPAPRQHFTRMRSRDYVLGTKSDHGGSDEDEPLLNKDGQPQGRQNSDTRRTSESRATPGSRKGSAATKLNSTTGPVATTFFMRKDSAASESTKGTAVPIRSDAPEMRQQLKFLGPSNAASKPRATRYTSVKIKPGVGTIPESKSTATNQDQPSHRRSIGITPERRRSADANETTRLVRSAGKDASDGTSALHAHYGSLDPPSHPRRTLSNGAMTASEASNMAEQKASSPSSQVRPPPSPTPSSKSQNNTNLSTLKGSGLLKPSSKMVVGSNGEILEDSDIGVLAPGREYVSGKRRTAHSGSITETMIDFGGMNKLVLETTSSSDGVEDGTASAPVVSPAGSDREENSNDGGQRSSSLGSPNAMRKRAQRYSDGKESGTQRDA